MGLSSSRSSSMSSREESDKTWMKIKAFTGKAIDWLPFKAKFKAMLEEKDPKLLDFVLEPVVKPKKKEEREAWVRMNRMLYAKLILFTEGAANGLVEQFEEERSGLGAWLALVAKYEVKSQVQKGALMRELIRSELESGEDPDLYFTRMERIQRQLKAMDLWVTDEMLVVIMLAQMEESYERLRTVLDTKDDLEYEEFKNQIRTFHSRLKADAEEAVAKTKEKNDDAAFATIFRGKCYRCGKAGHRKAECTTKESDIKKCDHCGKPGHVKKNCWRLKEEEGAAAAALAVEERIFM